MQVNMWSFHIDCVPVSWSAAQKGRNGFFDKKSKEKEFARWQLKSQYRGELLQGHLKIEFDFYIPIPKATSRARKRQMVDCRILPTSPDLTNLQKLYEDCLQGVIIDNDRYVSEVRSRKFYSERPGVDIRIKKIFEDNINKEESV